jgi:NAD(P)-dependent dehydrogenase (short-subunit alcohol dehydrogenase family)
MSLIATDESGRVLVAVDSLIVRPVAPEQLERARGGGGSLLGMEWVPLAREQSQSSAPGVRSGGPVAVVGEAGTLLEDALRAGGAEPRVYADLDALNDALAAGAEPPQTVLVLAPEDPQAPDTTTTTHTPAGEGAVSGELAGEGSVSGEGGVSRVRALSESVHWALGLVQRWVALEGVGSSRLVLVTGGAVAARAGEDVPGLAQAAVWGLVRSAQSEHPGRFTLVDLDREKASREALAGALADAHALEEPQIAIRGGSALVARLKPVALPAHSEPRWDTDGTVLITGGASGIGALLAKHLAAEHGVRHLLLAGRRGAQTPGAGELESELAQLGATVRIAACDVSDREQLRALLASISEEHPLTAVVHAAGVLDDGVIDSLTAERVDRVLAPKAHAAIHLHELTRELDLQGFVLYSSAAATFGNPGQANYAAANAYLDALAAHRHAHGLPATSIAWGPWTQTDGMADRLRDVDLARATRAGITPFTPTEGLQLLDTATTLNTPLLTAIRTNPATLRNQAKNHTLPTTLRNLIRLPAGQAAGAERDSLVKRLAAAPEHERARVLQDAICIHAAAVLGHASPAAIEVRQTFKELGFDSLAAVEFRNRLNAATGLALSATLIFDHPTPIALADRLLAELGDSDGNGSGEGGVARVGAFDPELDALERRLASLPSDDAERLRVKRRLQTILSSLGEEPAPRNGQAVAQMMRSASAEDVFDFIDAELRNG